jgi:hypothetical protein
MVLLQFVVRRALHIITLQLGERTLVAAFAADCGHEPVCDENRLKKYAKAEEIIWFRTHAPTRQNEPADEHPRSINFKFAVEGNPATAESLNQYAGACQFNLLPSLQPQ